MSRPARILIVALALTVAPGAGVTDLSAQEDYTIVRGNTLWDLARTFYGDPFQWTRIYEANRDRIQDPDLIYPGQTLLIPGEGGAVMEVTVMPAEEATPTEAAAPSPSAEPSEPMAGSVSTRGAGAVSARSGGLGRPMATQDEMARQAPPAPRAAVPEGLVIAAPFIVPTDTEVSHVGRITGYAGAEEVRAPRFTARLYDRMALEGEGGALRPGARLQAFRLGEVVPGVGRVAHPTGVVVVEASGAATPVGEVAVLFGALSTGDLLRPLPSSGLRAGVEPARVSSGATATVIAVAEDHALQTIGDHLFIDLGRGQTSVGDEFVPVLPGGDPAHPEGRMQVVAVQDGYATLRIVNMVNPVFVVGLDVRLSRRMPGQ